MGGAPGLSRCGAHSRTSGWPHTCHQQRLVFYCRTTSASTAPCTSRRLCCPTHCASYGALCQLLLRAFFACHQVREITQSSFHTQAFFERDRPSRSSVSKGVAHSVGGVSGVVLSGWGWGRCCTQWVGCQAWCSIPKLQIERLLPKRAQSLHHTQSGAFFEP